MTDSSLTTGIYVTAAVIGIVGGLLAIFLFIRHRQFSRPSLQVSFGLREPPDDVPKKLRKRPVTVFVIAPKRELRKPLRVFLFFALKNPGREAIRNVRVSFEYGEQYLISNKLLKSLANFQPTIVPELSDSESAAVLSSALSKEDIKTIQRDRKVSIFGTRAQVSWDVPIVRPGEGLILYDFLLLSGGGADDIQKLGFGQGGFSRVVALIGKIKGLLDYFVVNTFVFAENHENLNLKISVLRFASEEDTSEGLRKFSEALWLGQLPKPGLYFTEPISRWLRKRIWGVGRPSREIFRNELGLMRFSKVVEIKAQDKRLMVELPEHSEEQYFALSSPNYDYFELPAEVDSFDSLMNWLDLPTRPTLPSWRKRKEK